MAEYASFYCRCRRGAGAGFAGPSAENHYPPPVELETVHLQIALSLDLDAQRADGVVTHTIRSRRKGARELVLNAVDFRDVKVDGEVHELSHRYDGEVLKIRWDEAFGAGEERKVVIRYHVVKPSAGLYFSKPTEDAPSRPWFAATDNETERARYWLPCVDMPNVRPTLEFKLRAKEVYTALANGALISESAHDDGTTTTCWKLENPCPSYLTCFVVGDLVRADDGEFQDIPVAYFTSPPATPDDLLRSFGRTGEILAWMTERLGTHFPYPKYFQFALPGFGGAMENISLVSWDDIFVIDEELARELTWLVDQINVHEMAHSYFGDLVVCRHFEHAWLKESWASYMEACWLEHKHGQDEFRYELYRKAQRYFSEADDSYTRPIVTRHYASSFDLYDAHLYPGGACRLHVLRSMLGDDDFWGAVETYLTRYAEKVVETDDFRKVLEERSGRSLVRFFEQWLRSPGYPSLKVSFEYDAEQEKGTFEIEQTQKGEGVPTFDLELELGWVIDGKLSTRAVDVTRKSSSFDVEMPSEPEQVRVDPGGKALFKLELNPGDGKLRTQLTEATDVVGRILAAKELAKTTRRANIEAIRDAYPKEPFWGVRVEMAKALAEAGTQPALEALLAIVTEESHPMVLDPILVALGRFRDPDVAGLVETKLGGDELGPRGRAAAWKLLGRQREDAPLERLEERARTATYHAVEQGGAIAGLGESWETRAVSTLIELSQPGTLGFRARPYVARALGALSRGVERPQVERIRERLEALLRDDEDRVRWGAAAGLRAVGDARSIPALESYARTLPRQDAVGVERAITAIKGDSESAVKSEVDRLEARLRKLEKSLARLERARDEG